MSETIFFVETRKYLNNGPDAINQDLFEIITDCSCIYASKSLDNCISFIKENSNFYVEEVPYGWWWCIIEVNLDTEESIGDIHFYDKNGNHCVEQPEPITINETEECCENCAHFKDDSEEPSVECEECVYNGPPDLKNKFKQIK